MCVKGAREVQADVVATIADENLRIYAVWAPVLGADSRESALGARRLLPDQRTSHYWDGQKTLAKAFKQPLSLKRSLAWDVYMVFDAQASWDQAPPTPTYYMHQLPGRLPSKRLLEGKRLAAAVKSVLSTGAP